MKNKKLWIWQSKKWPNFIYDAPDTEEIYHKFGKLCMAKELLSEKSILSLKAQIFESEALATSVLEGELLDKNKLHSSVNLVLGIDTKSVLKNVQTDALANLLMDVKKGNEVLTSARLLAWNKALFLLKKKGLHSLHSGEYRASGHKEILSGTWHTENLHYVTPPAHLIKKEMTDFLFWINNETSMNTLIKSAIAHLWFLLIHPFEDGNRRIARDISDYVLSSSALIPTDMFTLAFEINEMKSDYYEMLDKVCQGQDMDISLWINWYLQMISKSLEHALTRIDRLKVHALFWDKIQDVSLNKRQSLILSKLLCKNIQDKELKTAYYSVLFNISKATAARDLIDLERKNILSVHGAGRGVYYKLYLEE